MKKRSKAASKPAKARPRKPLKRKGRRAPNALSDLGAAPARGADVARLTRELNEAREQQTATGDVLKVISRSRFDLQAVLDTLVKLAARLCEAELVAIHHHRDGIIQFGARFGLSQEWEESTKRNPIVPGRGTATGRVLLVGKTVQISDVKADPEYTFTEGQKAGGFRTVLGVPLEREGQIIGVIVLARTKVLPFKDRQIEFVQNFAAQAVIAIENARLLNELRKSLQQQTATADVLKVISRSTFDLQAVLDTLVQSAARLCDADTVTVGRPKGKTFYVEATYGFSREYAEFFASHPTGTDRGTVSGRVLLERKIVHVLDVLADPEYTYPVRLADNSKVHASRTLLGVPLLREGSPMGVMTFGRKSVRPFNDKQIELAETFADQAVIAIENTRLFEAEQQRTRELSEALEQQTATSEVLEVISSSPGDLEPVFAAMLERAVRICDATFGNIYRWDGDTLHLLAAHNMPPAFAEFAFAKFRRRSPLRSSPQRPMERALATKMPVHVADLAAQRPYIEERDAGYVAAVELGGARTFLAAPMLREDELIGLFSLYRQEVRPFTDKQIALVTSFAAQAVIAIENARLLSELRASLQEQTATAEVLQVISSSPGDLEPVFATMLEKAVRICDATFGNIYSWNSAALHLTASHNTPAGHAEHRRRSPLSFDEMPRAMRQMIQTQLPVQVGDIVSDDQDNSIARTGIELGGIRTVLNVPMVKESELIGAFILSRQEVRPFTDKQIELVQNFAAQAVIAIENARLLNELKESLEQQTATSEVLQVISSSPGELERVFTAMLANATRICEAQFGNFMLREGSTFRAVAWHGEPTYVEKLQREPLITISDDTRAPLAHLIETKEPVHVADVRSEPAYKASSFAPLVTLIDSGGARTLLLVPMLKENTLVGAISIYRREVRPFSDKQIELVQNFANQAVIAIENTRLLNELRQRTTDLAESLEQQTATSEVLQVISSSPGDLQLVFETMLAEAVRICDAKFGNIFRRESEGMHLVARHNTPPAFAEFRRRSPHTRLIPETLRGPAADTDRPSCRGAAGVVRCGTAPGASRHRSRLLHA